MATPSLASLLVQQTQATIYSAALSIATTLGLPVTSWLPGDPTRSLLFLESTFIATLENVVVGYIQSGFLDYASGTWLAILALEVYNVVVPQATFAETAITLTNAGGGVYAIEPGDLVVKSSASGATYTNTTGGTITGVGTPGATLTVTVIADVAGSASTASATAIDTLVTSYQGVTCTNPAAAIGTDAQDDPTTRQQCRNKLGSLSPNGPAAAYSFVALNPTLTGINTVTRARVYPDSETGDVQMYVAGPSGAVASGDVAAVQAAIQTWATPLCITPTVTSANPVTVAITYTLWIYQSVNQTSAQIQAGVQTALTALFASRPIGGDIIPPASTGSLDASLIESTILAAYTQGFRLTLTTPAADVALSNGYVAELGAVTATINIVPGG